MGSTTWIATQTDGNLAIGLDCSIATNTESALCAGEIWGPEPFFTDSGIGNSEATSLLTETTASITSSSFSATLSPTDFSYLPVTVTAGQDKLGSASGAQASSSSGGGDGNGAGILRSNLGLSSLVAGFLGMVMVVL